MRQLVIPPTSLGESLLEARLAYRHAQLQITSLLFGLVAITYFLIQYVDANALPFLSNGLCRVIFTVLPLTYAHNVLVSSIPEAAGYAERECDPTHAK